MDPKLFHIEWGRVAEVMVAIVILAFFLERALALLFEHRLFLKHFKGRGLKEVIALGIAYVICSRWQFDAISLVVTSEHVTRTGELITAAVIAGGSKASMRLFHDLMGARSSAHEHMHPQGARQKRTPETLVERKAAFRR